MSKMIRFATLCDCGRKSQEYTAWPTCRTCQEFACDTCSMPSTLVTGDGDGPDTVVCQKCQWETLSEAHSQVVIRMDAGASLDGAIEAVADDYGGADFKRMLRLFAVGPLNAWKL